MLKSIQWVGFVPENVRQMLQFLKVIQITSCGIFRHVEIDTYPSPKGGHHYLHHFYPLCLI